MMRTIFRGYNHSNPGFNIKCFHRTSRVLHVHNHYPLRCLPIEVGWFGCWAYEVDTEIGHLQHYRNLYADPDFEEVFNTSVMDTSLWKHKVFTYLNLSSIDV